MSTPRSHSLACRIAIASVTLLAALPAVAQTVTPDPAEADPAVDFNPPAERPTLAHAATIEDVHYGMATRFRWISVPRWTLDLFTAQNEPVSSLGVGLEFFRRRGDTDLVLGFGWQSMRPADGNWLGKNNEPSQDTDFVQAPGVGLVGLDFAVIRREKFSEFVGIHFGAGLGLALVTGTIYRTSAGPFCTDANAGDESKCYPAYDGNANRPIPPGDLPKTAGGTDSPTSPSRFVETGKPPVLPILNVVLGLNFRLPNVRGLEIRPIEIGFFNAFFVGGAIAYVM